ncbi:tetraspanin-11-like [Daphnia pulicaria]|uniref:tetraspanin-11-like n=1 Tax=Daphnia pulicaria TaxID=35523 RepID=UPI001EEB250F|nr:tetraspanin-11-like [Daphnia pulicaria]
MMARNVNSEIGAEVDTNNREAPLLSRYFRGVHRPAIRQTRNFHDENVRYRFLKWTALSVSTFFVICGVLGVGGTIWALSKTNYSHLTSSSTSAGVYMLMISVVLLLLSGVVGFVGVLRHNKPVMGSFIFLLFVSLVFLLIGGIWTYVTTTQTDQMSLERVANIVRFDYGKDSSKTALLDIVQQSFRCCGSSSFLSWMVSSYSLNQTEIIPRDDSGTKLTFTVPKSCCIEPASQNCQDHRHMGSNTTTNQFIYTKGCVQKLQASNTPYGTYALCVSLAIALLQIIGLVSSFLLFRTFHYLDTLS